MKFLEDVCDPDHPEHEVMLRWAVEDFDPERFEIESSGKNLILLYNESGKQPGLLSSKTIDVRLE